MKKSLAILLSIIMVLGITVQAFAISSVNVTGIKLDKKKLYLKIGQGYTIKATLAPENTTQKTLKYVTSNKNVVDVTKKGKIVGLGAGTATVTVYTANNDISAKLTVYVAKAEKTELTVEVFDRSTPGYQADNNFMTKYIQDKFGDPNNINVKFVPVLRSQEVDKLNVLMASNTAPDISFTYDDATIYNYIKNSGITDLTPFMDNAPNLKEYLGKDLLAYGIFSGKQMAIPAKRVIQGVYSAYIRKDWLQKLKLPVPKTTEEWYATMKAFKEKDPGKLGDKNIPFSTNGDPNNIQWPVQTLLDSFKTKVSEQDRMTLPNWTIPGYKDGMKFLNKLYNEGILNPQFALDKDGKQYEKDIAQGKVGFFICNYDFPLRTVPGLLTNLKLSVPGADLVACDPFTNYEGKHPKTRYNPNGLYLIVPKTSKHAYEAIKYLEWQSDLEVIKFLENGVKGDQYLNERNGIPMDFITNDKLPDNKKANFSDLILITNGKEFGDDDKNIEAAKYGYPGFEDIFSQAMKISLTDAVYMPHFESVINSQAKYKKTLLDLDVEIFVKSVTCKPEDFSKTYDSLTATYMKSGGQEVVDEKIKVYNDSKK